jgi:hypothetical protein
VRFSAVFTTCSGARRTSFGFGALAASAGGVIGSMQVGKLASSVARFRSGRA